MISIFHSNLLRDLSLILNDSDDYNVIIQVGENQTMKEFRAHSVILRARSPYFKSALSTNWIMKRDDMILFSKPNISPMIFEMILKYIYTGELDLTNRLYEDIFLLLIASDELLLEELVEYLQDYLIERYQNWIIQNLVLILNKFARYKKLHDYCLDSVCENLQLFITTQNLLSLDKDSLYIILSRDDLQIEEITAWNCLIKWGIENTPDLGNENNDISKWNYEALKNTLNQLIPLIRFVTISPHEFFDKVKPYKNIIPNNIYEEFENFYCNGILPKTIILPPRIGKFDSKIIKPKLANIIINWINNKDYYNIMDPYYKFKLIYRGSRDGINNQSFKDICNGRIASLVLIKVQESNKIFGGYSSIGFNSLGDNYLKTFNLKKYNALGNFIFSFENSQDNQNMKISRVINNSEAILDHCDTAFNFGQGSLSMSEQNLHVNNNSHNYEDYISTDIIYTIEDIETFIIFRQ
ncbi:hypothetical protein C1645_829704 [Glomus cerebriforme]|uniref:BTB/POZ domain-containing protein n=1 Tax=Glomus cerebriforme TaxID=658196 RepID=A0A397SQF8_9GLOM|nr:hypothetical protein C1645_829704 [Glomus cerebriforme]